MQTEKKGKTREKRKQKNCNRLQRQIEGKWAQPAEIHRPTCTMEPATCIYGRQRASIAAQNGPRPTNGGPKIGRSDYRHGARCRLQTEHLLRRGQG